MMLKLTKEKARHALFHVHGLDKQARGKAGALAVLDRHMCIQSDPIDVAGRNHDLTLQSRIADYKAKYLHDLLYKDRKLFEYYCKMASIMPIETYPSFQYLRDHYSEEFRPFFKEHPRETREILEALEASPVCSNDFKSEKKVDYWGKTQVYRVILERLFISGRTVLHHRKSGIKYYTLAEKVVPANLLKGGLSDRKEYQRALTLMIAKASRLVSPSRATEQWQAVGKTKDIAGFLDLTEKSGELFSLTVEGWKGKVFAPTGDEDIWRSPPEPEPAARFMAPLDPLLWNRKLFAEIYGHEYTWEIYKQQHQRKYGYYCLPVLFGGDYVGLIEPFLRKKDRVLEIRSFHVLDREADTAKFRKAVGAELERFARNLGAVEIAVTGKAPGFVKSAAKGFSG